MIEGIRHSITKFSHLHFTSTEAYRKRVIQLGEHPDTVFNVGAIGLDAIKKLKLLKPQRRRKHAALRSPPPPAKIGRASCRERV